MGKYHLTHKQEREITDEAEVGRLLGDSKFAVIAMCRDNEPYVVTMSYGFDESRNALYFHCANHGMKIDFMRANPYVCATVIDDRGYFVNECSHHYRTVVLRGKLSAVESLEEKRHGLTVMIDQLEENPGPRKEKVNKYDREFDDFTILRLDIEDITAKHGK